MFVDELDEVPDDRPVVFSAHGVPKSVPAEAQEPRAHLCRRDLPTRLEGPSPGAAADRRRSPHPLHRPCRPSRGDRHLRPGAARTRSRSSRPSATSPNRTFRSTANLAFLTQTTLSVDDTAAIVEALKARFPAIRAPRSEDICYATSNRQAAVKAIAPQCDRMLVIGAPNSSNSLRLAEVAERIGVPARLIETRGRHRLEMAGPAAHRWASPPAPRLPKSSSARSSMLSRADSTVTRGSGRPHARAHDLQASARARGLT